MRRGGIDSCRYTSCGYFTTQFIAVATRYQNLTFGEIGKLDGTNYPLWKMKVKSHLVLRESWEIGVELVPHAITTLVMSTTPAVTTSKFDISESAADPRCGGLGYHSGHDGGQGFTTIYMTDTSFEAWTILQDMCELNN